MKHSKKVRTGLKSVLREIVKNITPEKKDEKKSFQERVKQTDGKGVER